MITDSRDEIAVLETELERLNKAHAEYARKGRVVHTEILKVMSQLKKLRAIDKENKDHHQLKAQLGRDAIKQDQVVSALRRIGRETTAGPICKEIGHLFNIKLHNSEFAARYLEQVRKDERVNIRVVNATCNKYSLKEWNRKEQS